MQIIYVDRQKIQSRNFDARNSYNTRYTKLLNSVENFGILRPIIVRTDYTIIDGQLLFDVTNNNPEFKKIPVYVIASSKSIEQLYLEFNFRNDEWDGFSILKLLQKVDISTNNTWFSNTRIVELVELLQYDWNKQLLEREKYKSENNLFFNKGCE